MEFIKCVALDRTPLANWLYIWPLSGSSLEKRLDQRIDGLDKRMDDFGKRMDGCERQLEIALDVRERLAVVEARLQRG